MNTSSLGAGWRPFNISQDQAWGTIRQHQRQVEDAAFRLAENAAIRFSALALEEGESPGPSSQDSRPLSKLERLPQEVLIAIMKSLDHQDLYRLSQTTEYFLRLSFDNTFEMDPSWRTFRHTVDTLSNGPKNRVIGWVGT